MAGGMGGTEYVALAGSGGQENVSGEFRDNHYQQTGNHTVGSHNITLTAFKVIGLTTIILIGVVGNLLVCISVLKFRNLRIVANYFIVSLAVADLAVSSVVMPFALYQEVNDWNWWLGAWLCDLWVSVDVLTATASIWNLCGISVDRFLAITRPIKYARRRTPCMAMVVILSMWSVSFLISIPALIYVGGFDSEGQGECALNVSPIFQVISSALSFYIPCFILLIVYYKIFRSVMALSAKKPGMREKIQRDAQTKVVTMQTNLAAESKEQLHTEIKTNTQNALTVQNNGRAMSKRPSDDGGSSVPGMPPSSTGKSREKSSTKKISVARERRATSVLAIVVTIFICCWLPFFITNVVMGLCEECRPHITFNIFNSVTWMGWCNSAANPIIYTIFNREFRNAFHRILTCNTRHRPGMR
ncbi:probable G-protein coupled receptor No18 [Diadema antillarum]|uniref:probable G-protein coupled receptor No18 n=1 Tax=Diadema antillarum TaxID=105358 RepID=UPI003A845F12